MCTSPTMPPSCGPRTRHTGVALSSQRSESRLSGTPIEATVTSAMLPDVGPPARNRATEPRASASSSTGMPFTESDATTRHGPPPQPASPVSVGIDSPSAESRSSPGRARTATSNDATTTTTATAAVSSTGLGGRDHDWLDTPPSLDVAEIDHPASAAYRWVVGQGGSRTAHGYRRRGDEPPASARRVPADRPAPRNRHRAGRHRAAPHPRRTPRAAGLLRRGPPRRVLRPAPAVDARADLRPAGPPRVAAVRAHPARRRDPRGAAPHRVSAPPRRLTRP